MDNTDSSGKENRSSLQDLRLGAITKELNRRFKEQVLLPYAMPFLSTVAKIGFCTFVALFVSEFPVDRKLFWLLVSSFSITYGCIHLLYSLSEVKTIVRAFSFRVANRPRLPFVLLAFGISFIIYLQILKSGEKDSLSMFVFDGVTGVTASLVAAALYQILEMWRELREKRNGRQQLLFLLGVDEKKFSENKDNRIKIILPGFKMDDISRESFPDAFRGEFAFNLGARNRLGHKINSLCASEDVEAFRVLTQMFQERDIPWELVYPEEIFSTDIINTQDYNAIISNIGDDFSFIPSGHYVAIGLYSNLLTMASNFIEIRDKKGGLAFLRPFDETAGENPAIVTRDDLIQTRTLEKTDNSTRRSAMGSRYFRSTGKRPLWRYYLGQRPGGSNNLDSCFIFRRIIPNGSLFIFGGISAPGTKACSAYLQDRWGELIIDIETECKRKNRSPSIAKFVRIFYADIDPDVDSDTFSFNHGYIDVD